MQLKFRELTLQSFVTISQALFLNIKHKRKVGIEHSGQGSLWKQGRQISSISTPLFPQTLAFDSLAPLHQGKQKSSNSTLCFLAIAASNSQEREPSSELSPNSSNQDESQPSQSSGPSERLSAKEGPIPPIREYSPEVQAESSTKTDDAQRAPQYGK